MGALEAVYREAYTALRHRSLLPGNGRDFRVRFYPYAGLKSTIFERGDHYEVRLADVLEPAPLDVHYSLACILVSKLDRRLRLMRAERDAYQRWSRRPEVLEQHEAARRERGAKKMASPQGRAHDLTLLFHRLNRTYFGALLSPVALGWSLRRSRGLWGHHDNAHGAIVLNKILDHPRVPSYVVEAILFHEMLHHQLGVQVGASGRRIVHSREFHRQERRFADYEAAKRFLEDIAKRRIRL